MARSSAFSVKSMLPWVNCCETAASRTPLPALCAPTANTSANSAREPLNPVVLTLATLLAMTPRSAEAALRPLSAIGNGMFRLLEEKKGSVNPAYLVDGQESAARHVQRHRRAVATEVDAVDGRVEQRFHALDLVAAQHARAHPVMSWLDGPAFGVEAVPFEPHEARLLRPELELLHQLPGRVRDVELHAGSPGRQLDGAREDTARGDVTHVGRGEHRAADERRGLQHLVGLQRGLESRERTVQLLDAVDRSELGELP